MTAAASLPIETRDAFLKRLADMPWLHRCRTWCGAARGSGVGAGAGL